MLRDTLTHGVRLGGKKHKSSKVTKPAGQKRDTVSSRPTRSASSPAPKSGFHFVFFSDRGPTRNLKVSRKWAWIAGTSLAVLVTWALVSAFAVLWVLADYSQMQTKWQRAQTVLLDYQIRYEALLDTIYPQLADPDQPVAEAPESAADPKGSVVSSEELKDAKATTLAASSGHSDTVAVDSNPTPAAQANGNTPDGLKIAEGSPVLIEGVQTQWTDRKLRLSFNLVRQGRAERVAGYVWAIWGAPRSGDLRANSAAESASMMKLPSKSTNREAFAMRRLRPTDVDLGVADLGDTVPSNLPKLVTILATDRRGKLLAWKSVPLSRERLANSLSTDSPAIQAL